MFSNPATNVAKFGLTPGMVVADFGCGDGAYSLVIAEQLRNTNGRVYAIDVQNGLLERLARQAQERRINNLKVIWGNIEKLGGTKLADGAVDLVVLANTIFLSDAKYTLALEAKRILRPAGRVIVIDWNDSYGGLGPAPAQVVKPTEVKKVFTEASFVCQSEFVAGDHHYGLIFNKK